ncbi:M3 family metallopeptidase [uncultured Hymenobacter sp.]|uniref:M3 family metallopeptidase n=1 Tax=uncultured Hymenobacter sp. TaxID=170016 RepID=UPI0035CA5A9D
MQLLLSFVGQRRASFLAALGLSLTFAAASTMAQPAAPTPPAPAEVARAARAADQPPLLQPWAGPYGGVPAFDKVKVADFKPALEAAMAESLGEIQAIASNPQPANFENTIAALERSGRTLDRVQAVYGVWSSALNDAAFSAVEAEMAPRLAGFSDQITQNAALFKRIEAVYKAPQTKKLTAEQQRLTEVRYKEFVRAGAQLDAPAKARLSQLNQTLAGLFTKFSQNVLAEEAGLSVELKTEADLAGLPPSLREGAKATVATRQSSAVGVIANTRSSVDPFLTYSDQRALREKVWRMFVSRGDNGGQYDNNALITQILKLRAERAKLLGYPTHAHLRLDNTMAKTPENAMKLMLQVWEPAVARVHEEVADMQALAKKEGAPAGFKVEPWDYRYYAEKVRKARYDLDQNEVKQYLQLDKLREGMFFVAGELFNFTFAPVTDVPVYHPDVRVWQVKDKTSGQAVGLWYFDPYARPGKNSGAWMNAYRNQERVDGAVTTIVSNNSNFIKPAPGEAVLISWDDARTLFHEFGHALHGLSSNVTYPTLSGTSVVRDYVEFPSQVLENWLPTPQVLSKYALHYKTGEPIPQRLVDRINKASTFNSGFATAELLASALVDMKLHLAGEQTIDPDRFERETLAELKMPTELVMRHRTPQFSHVFSSDGYSAGYYSYVWSVVLAADAFSAFTEAPGGPYDKALAARLRQHVFTIGNTVDPAAGYRAFRGRDPRIDALMKQRGFSVVAGAAKGKPVDVRPRSQVKRK